ncbi:MAG TPA: ATP-binding protein, partial [Streptosporangiaceae bacterium]
MTHTPPSASAGGYPPDTERDATYLQPYATGGISQEESPDTDEYATRGHRSSRRPGPLRRLLRRREQPETERADPLAPEADRLTHESSWPPDEADDAEGRPPGYRAQHRARYQAGYPGAAPLPPGEDMPPSYPPALDQAAREHLSAFTPDDGTGSPWAEPGSWGPGAPPPGPFGSGRPAPGQVGPDQTAHGQTAPGHTAHAQSAPGRPAPGPAGPGGPALPAGPGGSAPGGPAAGPGPAGPGPGPLDFPAGSAGLAGPGGPSSGAAGQAPFAAGPRGAPIPPAAMAPGPAFSAAPAIPAAAPAPSGANPPDPLYRVLGGLAMRDLTLVESLLQVVEKLESHEEDAEQLELLFRIDHLATRMRRNSENLLVLAGHDTEGRDFEPVPLLDVARAAISEITDYSRAQVTSLPDVRVIGLAGDDLSHILAELLDNATSKSPQSAAVVVRGERTGDGTLLLSVEDAGIGIPADRLADINKRLSRAPVLDASATRHMGLYVVGRLAYRHGIRVQLRERPYGGIAAHIIIPDELIRSAPGEPPARGDRPDHPRPRPRPQPSAPPSGPVPRPSSGPVPRPSSGLGSPSGPASPPTPAAPGVPAAPRFQPADPATLPRRTPGQPAPANGMPVPGVTAPGEPAPPHRTPGQPAPAQPAPAQAVPGRPVTGQPPLSAPVADYPITGQAAPGQTARPLSSLPGAGEPGVREPG